KLIDSGELGTFVTSITRGWILGPFGSILKPSGTLAPTISASSNIGLATPNPFSIGRQGMAYMQEGIDDVVFLSLEYPGKVIANIHVSWLDPQKVRKMIIVGSRKMEVYDDIFENKILIYDKGIDRCAILGENMDFDRPQVAPFNYRSGDLLI